MRVTQVCVAANRPFMTLAAMALGTSAALTLFAMFCFIAAVWRELDMFLVLVSGEILIGLWAS